MKNEILSHLVISRENLAPKKPLQFPVLELIKYSCHDTIAQVHAHMTSSCFSVPGSETSPIFFKFSQFSAQISGFSADFHRKLLDIVKQHPNNAKIWADSMF